MQSSTSLQKHADGLWSIRHPFKMMGSQIGTRTTLASLPGDGLMLHSPGPLEEADAEQIRKVGHVRTIVAPNLMHHLFVEDAEQLFPDARVLAAPGLTEKVGRQAFDGLLDGSHHEIFEGAVEYLLIEGIPKLNEVAFFHRPSRTLLLTDLAFNLRESDSWFTRVAMHLNDAYDKFGPSRIMRWLIDDRQALRESLKRILKWDFERIVVPHGEIVEDNARATFEEAFRAVVNR